MTPATVQLVQFTDPHLFADPGGRLRGVPTLAALRATVAEAAADIAGAAGILLTGDLVHDEAGGYAHLPAIFGGLGKPVLWIPGNHDLEPEAQTPLAGAPFQRGGHRDFGAWRVVMLDSRVPGRASGELAVEELSALDRAIAQAPAEHVLVALHHHPVPLDSQWLDTVGLVNSDRFFDVLDRHPRVRGVVFGHVHQAFESRRGNVRIMGTPSTCAQFLPGSAGFAVDTRPPAYRVLKLEPDGRIETSVCWLSAAALASSAAA